MPVDLARLIQPASTRMEHVVIDGLGATPTTPTEPNSRRR